MSTVRHRGHVPLYTSGFQGTYDKEGRRERLEADLAAFDRAGGRIEVLGTTPLRRKPAKPDGASKAPTPVSSPDPGAKSEERS
ncbi:MAG TPA: hypothetical protein VGD21_10240 [Lysobacter sp.]